MSALVAVLGRADALASADLRTRLQWIEDAAAAIEATDLGDDGVVAATHFRAALGAVVAWSKSPPQQRSLVALEAVLSTLLQRAMVAMARASAEYFEALVDERAPQRAACAEAARLLSDVAVAAEKGSPLPKNFAARVRELSSSLPKTP